MGEVQKQAEPQETLRLDKWLWAARFFKTRPLAAEAINGGKVHLDGKRTKPGKPVHPGARLEITKGPLSWEVIVKILPRQRRPAAEAAFFYEETPESVARRERQREDQRLTRLANPAPAAGKPSKRDRRMIHRFTGKDG